MTLSPSQNVSGPDAVMTGDDGSDRTNENGAEVPDTQCAGSLAVTV